MRERDRQKFVELASKRVSKALHDIQLIGNLSNRSNYHYTDEDVAKIFRALNSELRSCRQRFEMALNNKENSRFSLEK
jgi:hypothetical protein